MYVHFIGWVYGFSVHSSPTLWLVRWWKVDSISPIFVTPFKDLSLLAGDGQIISYRQTTIVSLDQVISACKNLQNSKFCV